MNTTSTLDNRTVQQFPVQLWAEFVVLGLGLPAAIWVASKLIKLSISAATQGSPGERFLWWIAGPAIAEWMFVLGVVLVLRHRQLSLQRHRRFARGKLGCLGICALFRGPCDWRQPALPSPDGCAHLSRLLPTGISLGSGADDGHYRWIL